jgi:hypothetical protein
MTVSFADLFISKWSMEDTYFEANNRYKCLKKIAIATGVVAGVALTIAVIAALAIVVPNSIPLSLNTLIIVGGAAGGFALVAGTASAVFGFGTYEQKKYYEEELSAW